MDRTRYSRTISLDRFIHVITPWVKSDSICMTFSSAEVKLSPAVLALAARRVVIGALFSI